MWSTFRVMGIAMLLCVAACRGRGASQGTRDGADDPARTGDGGAAVADLSGHDVGSRPGVVVIPDLGHLAAGVPPNVRISVDVRIRFIGKTDAIALVRRAVTLREYPAGTPVALGPPVIPRAGDGTTAFSLVFPRAGDLETGRDYHLRVKPGGALQASREHTLFHVGRLLRVRRMTFRVDRASKGNMGEVLIAFSDLVDLAKVRSGLSVRPSDRLGSLGWSLAAASRGAATGIRLTFAAGTPLSRRLIVGIAADVGRGGLKLDGKYAGPGRSAAFSATVRPSELKANADGSRTWEPTFRF